MKRKYLDIDEIDIGSWDEIIDSLYFPLRNRREHMEMFNISFKLRFTTFQNLYMSHEKTRYNKENVETNRGVTNRPYFSS